MEQYFTIREAANELGASTTSVLRWLDDGSLKGTTTAGGRKLVSGMSVLAFKVAREREKGGEQLMADIHGKLQPLPPVAMEPLRSITATVHELEMVAARGRAEDASCQELLSSANANLHLANIHLVLKAIADYPLEEWDDDPLVIRRWSELHERG